MGRRRVFRVTAALSGVLLLASATAAGAQWRDGGRGGDRYGGGWGGSRGGYAPMAYRGGEGRYGAASGYGAPRYVAPSGYGGGRDRGGRDGGGRDGGGRDGGGAGWRRGQVLPPNYRDAYVPDPGRYHLRAAPPGFGWIGDGRNAYLTQRSTGMVLDSVPGAYEPAPAYGRGRGRRGPR